MKRSRTRLPVILTAAVLAVTLILYLLFRPGVFQSEPTVAVQADNCYRETLTVVMDYDYEPFSFRDKNGIPTGHDVELINEIANRLKKNVVVNFLTYGECLDRIRSGNADLVMSTTFEEDIEGITNSIPVVSNAWTAFSKGHIVSVPDLFDKKIGIIGGADPLEGYGLSEACRPFPTYSEAFAALESGELDCVIAKYPVGNSILKENGYHDIKATCEVTGSSLSIGADAGNTQLMDQVNEVIKELSKEGFLKKLTDKWCGNFVSGYSLKDFVEYYPGMFFLSIMILVILVCMLGVSLLNRRYDRAYQKQLQVARDEAQSANRSKSTFLFNMSHDIRTPMNAIIGYTAMAKKYAGNKQVKNCLDKIDMSGKQLLQLVNQVLEMSRIESGRITLSEDPADVIERANGMETIVAADCNIKNIKFKLHIGSVAHKDVLTDVSRVNQIVTNIIGNAVKYTPEGGRIDYYLEEQPCDRDGYGLYEITVKDTGIGMSEEFLSHIFEEFSRESTSTVSHIQGTGLGMSIVKKFVDLMGGTIDIQSKLGEGTAMKVSIPMKWNSHAGEDNSEAQNARQICLEGKRILLVEDNEMNREIATELLEEEGVYVETAEDGDIAVHMLKKTADAGDYYYYNAVLMDIQMPRMNGYEATKIIREVPVPEGIRMPIIALSANAFEEDRQKSLEAGMDDHIAKPIDIQKLKETLAKYL